MKSLLGQGFVSLGTHLVRYGDTQLYAIPDARLAIQAADPLHPRFIKGNTAQHAIMIYCRGHYGKRPTIHAAAAITLLGGRQCYHDTHRLAIVANMCDYDFQLDTKAVRRNCTSPSQAILALALNNGGTSLLVPETSKPLDEISPDLAQKRKLQQDCSIRRIFHQSGWNRSLLCSKLHELQTTIFKTWLCHSCRGRTPCIHLVSRLLC